MIDPAWGDIGISLAGAAVMTAFAAGAQAQGRKNDREKIVALEARAKEIEADLTRIRHELVEGYVSQKNFENLAGQITEIQRDIKTLIAQVARVSPGP